MFLNLGFIDQMNRNLSHVFPIILNFFPGNSQLSRYFFDLFQRCLSCNFNICFHTIYIGLFTANVHKIRQLPMLLAYTLLLFLYNRLEANSDN